MRAARLLIAVLSLAVHASAFAGEAEQAPALSRDWKRVRSANFTVVGNGRDAELRAALAELERFRLALLTLSPSLTLDPAVPTVLVLFKSDSSLTRFKPRNERGKIERDVAGYFVQHPDINYMVAGAWADRRTTFDVIFHEYTHYVIHRTSGTLPRWADEGLAEFYSTFFTDDKGRGVLGRAPAWRIATLRDRAFLPYERLLTNEGAAKAFRSDDERQRFYAQAWALVHYSILGPRSGQLGAYLRALEKGRPVEDAFREVYKVSFDALQQELRTYVDRQQLPAALIDLPGGAAAAAAPVERLTEVDALQLQGDLLMRTGADDDAERRLTAALKLDPRHLGARVSHAGVLLHRGRADEAIAILQAVTAEAPLDFAGHYWLGANLSRAHRWDEALRAWGQALAINEQSPEAWLELSVAALALGRASQSQAAFARAHRLDGDPSLYFRRAHRLFEVGQDAAIVRDVASFLRAAGWGNESAPYMAFLGALAHLRLEDTAAADALLAEAAASMETDSWPAAVAGFLRGTVTPEALLKRGRDVGEQTEAHAYIGLRASIAGRREEALEHLTWVAKRGSRSYTEYGLAVAELRRLQAATASTRPARH